MTMSMDIRRYIPGSTFTIPGIRGDTLIILTEVVILCVFGDVSSIIYLSILRLSIRHHGISTSAGGHILEDVTPYK